MTQDERRKIKFLIGIILFLIFILILGWRAFYLAHQDYHRSSTNLLNQYYKLKNKNSAAAKQALELVLKNDPDNQIALNELQSNYIASPAASSAIVSVTSPPVPILPVPLPAPAKPDAVMLEKQRWVAEGEPQTAFKYSESGYLALSKKDPAVALIDFQKAYLLVPTPQLAAQIGYLLMDTKNYAEAKKYFEQSQELNAPHSDPQIKKELAQLNLLLQPQLANLAVSGLPNGTLYEQLMNRYYYLKKVHPVIAFQLLQAILVRYPTDVLALKEAGYYELNAKNYPNALIYFKHAYDVTHDEQLAMQIGYILSLQGDNGSAYEYFVTASKAADQTIMLNAEHAMDNLSGMQTKIIPSPFFVDLYYAPFMFSRFALLVNPIIVRAGITLNEAHHLQLYTSLRYTRDNRSSGGEIPQIYESDQAVAAVGISVQPLLKIPVITFAEVGKAYNLIDIQPRVVNDTRIGAAGYQAWGRLPEYSPSVVYPLTQIGSFYGSIIYYSQYNNNVIGDFRLREGFRAMQYKASTIDLYLTGHAVLDTQHQFYNNIFEWGPGIGFTPTTRYNLTLRLEFLRGYYLPVNSPSVNPYGSQYHNNVLQFVTYMKF